MQKYIKRINLQKELVSLFQEEADAIPPAVRELSLFGSIKQDVLQKDVEAERCGTFFFFLFLLVRSNFLFVQS
jgi:hypothetical protein